MAQVGWQGLTLRILGIDRAQERSTGDHGRQDLDHQAHAIALVAAHLLASTAEGQQSSPGALGKVVQDASGIRGRHAFLVGRPAQG